MNGAATTSPTAPAGRSSPSTASRSIRWSSTTTSRAAAAAVAFRGPVSRADADHHQFAVPQQHRHGAGDRRRDADERARRAAPSTSSNDVRTRQDVPYTTPVTVTIAEQRIPRQRARAARRSTAAAGRSGRSRSRTSRSPTRSSSTITSTRPIRRPPARTITAAAFDGTAKSLRIERSEIAENCGLRRDGSDVTRSGGLHLYNDAVDRQGPGDTMAVKIINSTISGNASSATAGAMVAIGNVALELVQLDGRRQPARLRPAPAASS